MNQIPEVLLDNWYRCGLRLVTWDRWRRRRAGPPIRRIRRRHWILRLLLHGRLELHLPSGVLPVEAPTAVLLPPEQQFIEEGLLVGDRLDMLGFDFETLTLPGHPDPLRQLVVPALVPFDRDDDLGRPTGAIPSEPARTAAERLRIRATLHRLLVEFLLAGFAGGHLHCQAGRPPRWLADSRRLAAQRFGDPDLDLGAIARIAGVTPQALGRAFRRHYGLPVMAWLRHERIHNACTMLRNDDAVSIGEVARACGYRSGPLFARHFRAITGRSARAWRRAAYGSADGP